MLEWTPRDAKGRETASISKLPGSPHVSLPTHLSSLAIAKGAIIVLRSTIGNDYIFIETLGIEQNATGSVLHFVLLRRIVTVIPCALEPHYIHDKQDCKTTFGCYKWILSLSESPAEHEQTRFVGRLRRTQFGWSCLIPAGPSSDTTLRYVAHCMWVSGITYEIHR